MFAAPAVGILAVAVVVAAAAGADALAICVCVCVWVCIFVYGLPALAINLLGLYVIIEVFVLADCIFGFFSTTIISFLLFFVCFIGSILCVVFVF